jgi:hypothetical protein
MRRWCAVKFVSGQESAENHIKKGRAGPGRNGRERKREQEGREERKTSSWGPAAHYCIGLNTLLSDEDQLLLQGHSLFRSTLRSTSNSLYTSTKQYHKFTRNHNFTSENHSFKLSKEEYLSILETCEVHETSDVKPVVSVSTISAKFEIFKKCLLDTEYSTVSQCITHLPSHPTIGELSRFKKLNFEQHSTFKLVSLCLLRRYLCTFFLDYEECKMQKRIAETLCVNFQIPQGL